MGIFGNLLNRIREASQNDDPIPGSWRVEGKKLVREYEFAGLQRAGREVSLRIECILSKFGNGTIVTYVDFHLRPCRFLLPSRERFKSEVQKVPFSVGLVASGAGAGTEESPLVNGGMFEVSASGGADSVMLRVLTTQAEMACIKAIASGNALTFTIVDHNQDPAVRLKLQLPNDRTFIRLYNKLFQEVKNAVE